MANNRMGLCHKPTGLAVCIGKRMAWGWYGAPEQDAISSLYLAAEREGYGEGQQDCFHLVMENVTEALPGTGAYKNPAPIGAEFPHVFRLE